MKLDIDQIKLDAFRSQAQVTFFEPGGKVVQSCQTLVTVKEDTSIYEQFVFLESLQDVLDAMGPEDVYDFPAVEWEEGTKGLFHLYFKTLDHEGQQLIQWAMVDKTEQYKQLLNLQQGRNDKAIGEEFALIQKKVAEVENQLVSFQNEELKRVQQFKSDFFAQVSHEMRTPLNSISGLVSLIMEDQKKTEEYLPALQATSKHLNSIINDILDLSKIDAGKLTFEAVDFDLTALAHSIMKGFEFGALEQGISLNLSVPDEPILVKSDPTRVAQVLYNLVGNSLKFTEKGYVSLEIKVSEASEGRFDVDFLVEDTGIGMEPSQIETLLEPYQQAEDKTARIYGGTGLGLHIALKLVEAMDSQLEIRSAPNKGTKMSFGLRLTKGANLRAQQAFALSLEGRKVLVAEDDALNRKILEEILKKAGAQPTLVEDGLNSEKALSKGDFDLLITDINIPWKTGWEVFQDLRKAGNDIPVLFVSGSELEVLYELEAYEGWGFTIKPLNINKVREQISRLLPKAYPTELNLTSLKEMISGDMAFFKDLLQTILDTLPQEMAKLKAAVSEQDAETSTKVLHKIRPSIDYMGIPELTKERHWLHAQAEAGKLDEFFSKRMSEFDPWVRQALKKLAREID